jgi:hypothetical protein
MIKNGFFSHGSKAPDGVDEAIVASRCCATVEFVAAPRSSISSAHTGAFCRCCAATFSTAVRLVASAAQQQTERTGRELSLSRPPRKGRRKRSHTPSPASAPPRSILQQTEEHMSKIGFRLIRGVESCSPYSLGSRQTWCRQPGSPAPSSRRLKRGSAGRRPPAASPGLRGARPGARYGGVIINGCGE